MSTRRPRERAAPGAKGPPVEERLRSASSPGRRSGSPRHELGATIVHPGNSRQRETGGWRLQDPVLDPAKCTACALCYFYCPDDSILLEGSRAVGIDLAHCKGCGICARECGPGAISMRPAEKE